MKFGIKKKDAPANEGGGSGRYIKYFKKGEKTLRFLEDTDEWTKFFDHFSQSKMRSYPCTGDRETCPGCTSENEKERSASCRFLVNALDPETGYVDLWKVPVSIIDDLERYEAKDGTITARLYNVIQFKSEGKVKYSVEKEERVATPVSDYADKMMDHEQALQEAYDEAWGQDPADHESPVQQPSKRPKKAKKDVSEAKDMKEAMEAKGDDDEPPFSKRAEESDPEDETVIDESELYQMDVDDLKNLFRQAGIPVPRTSDPAVLRERLMETLAE